MVEETVFPPFFFKHSQFLHSVQAKNQLDHLHYTKPSEESLWKCLLQLWYFHFLLQEAIQGGQQKVWQVFKLEIISQKKYRVLGRIPIPHDRVQFASQLKRWFWQKQERRERGQEKSTVFNVACTKWLSVFKIALSYIKLLRTVAAYVRKHDVESNDEDDDNH